MRRRVLDPKGWLQTSPTEETSKCVPSRPMSCTFFFFGGAAAGKYPLPESSQGRICRPLSQPELRTTRVQGRRGQAAAARDTIAVTIGRPLDSGCLSYRTSHVYMHMGGVGHTTAGGGKQSRGRWRIPSPNNRQQTSAGPTLEARSACCRRCFRSALGKPREPSIVYLSISCCRK